MTRAFEKMSEGLQVLVLENEAITISILPEVGAKILALIDKSQGRNLLWENPRIRPQRFPIDSNFDNYWCGGWDDAFPTADACVYQGEPYPNLGELRSLSWTVEELVADDGKASVRMSAFGPVSAIKATKTVSLLGRIVEMRFEIENLSPLPVDFLWGTHPAFAIKEGTRLFIPARTGIVGQASHPTLGSEGERYGWPFLNGRDMSVVPDIKAGLACGHYAVELEDGWFAVETAGSGIVYDFPLETCRNLWMWLVYGGWRGYYHAIIEPWTGYPVNLPRAVEEGRHNQLAPGGRFDVTVRCTTYEPDETCHSALERLRKG